MKTADDGIKSLSVMIDGIHCAACISKIEGRLMREAGMRNVRLNFTTHRLGIEWEGPAASADAFIRVIESMGYKVYPYDILQEKNNGAAEEKFLLLCLGVAGFSLGNIMLLSLGLWTTTQDTMGMATRDFMHWMSACIALPTILFSGRPFFHSALNAVRAGTTNMDVPISVALILTSGISLFETFQHGAHAYFDSVVMLVFFLLIGRYLDIRARRQARSAAGDLLSAAFGFANIITDDGCNKTLPVNMLEPGMILRVASGEKIKADGSVIQGITTIDTALVTGETMPRDVKEGSSVYAGTINISAPILVQIIKAADDTLLSDIIRLMEKAGQAHTKYIRIADRLARLYTPVVHIMAAVAFAGWIAAGMAWQPALLIAATVLIITCPCALALAVPVAQVLATSELMKKGVLVKSGDALERLAAADIVFIDKTGTLTLGRPVPAQEFPDEHDIRLAASLASYSTHPLSQALAAYYTAHYKLPLLDIKDVNEYSGRGLEGKINEMRVALGSCAWCGDESAPPSGRMELWLCAGQCKPVPFYFTDQLREDAGKTMQQLQSFGLEVVLISGDRPEPVAEMAMKSGISRFYAEMSPVEKYDFLQRERKLGKRVLMVGDGLNDAPVLAASDVSMSPASASDIAQNAADIVFMGEGLNPLVISYKTAILCQKIIRQNFALAIVYNIFAIPVAMAGFVTPLAAALAMSVSSLAVIANSFRLRIGEST